MKSKVEVKEVNTGQYYLTFHPDVVRSSFDGHTWSLLVQTYCRMEKITLGEVIHDPENDMYSAIASKIEPLKKIATAIEVLTSNDNLCEKYISIINEQDQSQDDDDLTTEEFLEWMVEAGYDMTVPKTFRFDLDRVKDAEQASTIQSEIEKKGYKTKVEILDGEVYFEVIMKIKPLQNVVLEIESFLQSIAVKFGIKYIGFGI